MSHPTTESTVLCNPSVYQDHVISLNVALFPNSQAKQIHSVQHHLGSPCLHLGITASLLTEKPVLESKAGRQKFKVLGDIT